MISFKKTIVSAYELYFLKPAYYHKGQKNMNDQEFLTINILELNRETKCWHKGPSTKTRMAGCHLNPWEEKSRQPPCLAFLALDSNICYFSL